MRLFIAMIPNIEINSLSINKLKNNSNDFSKYDIEVSLDETESTDSGVKLNYKLVLLSDPANIKINVDGMVSVHGNESEVSKQLESDQKNIPVIVNKVYQEIFPLFYVISKSLQIPCPAHRLAQVSSTSGPNEDASNTHDYDNNETVITAEDLPENKTEQPGSDSSDKEIIEPSVSSN